MQNNRRAIMAGGIIGLLSAGMLALPSALPPAMADEEPARTLLKSAREILPRPLDETMFVKPRYEVEPSVSELVLDQLAVRKIGYGKTTFVTITRTPSGTYSSDGLASAHVRYPGFHQVGSAGSIVDLGSRNADQ